MQHKLREISIRGLHGQMDITIPIEDNRLVLVGVNGLGKTTVVNILYYFLSQQWHRLRDVQFSEIAITLGRRKLRVTHEMLNPPTQIIHQVTRRLPISVRRRVIDNPQLQSYLISGDIRSLADELDLPRAVIARHFAELRREDWQSTLFEDEEGSDIAQTGKRLEQLIDSQILYLPTYRRIEQDLRALFPHFDEDIRDAVSRHLRRDRRERSFLELVQFGMEDVQDRISFRINLLKEQVRVELNELAGSYLRDVISGEAERYRKDDIEALDESDVDRILGRVEERTLPAVDKDRLRKVIREIRSPTAQSELPQSRYLAHFFSKLVEMYRSQQQREAPLREFARVCNQYLQGKHFEFGDTEYTLVIRTDQDTEIEMGHLSSGEKQIVSLFSHIYLSDAESFCIIIDEPELSLSVEWQKRLLPDLFKSGRCTFLAAVTHSPFIFDNEFEEYATDLSACTESI